MKSFKQLYNFDVSKYVQKKPTFKKVNGKLEKMPEKYWLKYIEWSTAIFLLYENGASKVTHEFVCNDKGYPAFFDESGNNPFVKVKLIVDEDEYNYQYPVINGNIVDGNPNQMAIHRAQQRALVKCIAVNTGLGLSLWQKEEQHYDEVEVVNDESGKPELKQDMPQWKEAVKALKNGFKISDIRKKYYVTEENINKLLDESI